MKSFLLLSNVSALIQQIRANNPKFFRALKYCQGTLYNNEANAFQHLLQELKMTSSWGLLIRTTRAVLKQYFYAYHNVEH